MYQPVQQSLDCLLNFRKGDATLVLYRLWAHGFQAASGGPGTKRAFYQFIPVRGRVNSSHYI